MFKTGSHQSSFGSNLLFYNFQAIFDDTLFIFVKWMNGGKQRILFLPTVPVCFSFLEELFLDNFTSFSKQTNRCSQKYYCLSYSTQMEQVTSQYMCEVIIEQIFMHDQDRKGLYWKYRGQNAVDLYVCVEIFASCFAKSQK